MGRRPLLAANWKMYKTVGETREFFDAFLPGIEDVEDRDIVIAPPFTALVLASQLVRGVGNVSIAAQNMFHEDEGAFTGEISPLMLKDIGVEFVILGHSERRHIFGETDELIGKKVEAALRHGLVPILCVGESLEEREEGMTRRVIEAQLQGGLEHVSDVDADGLVIAYEPVWAIGTGKTATPQLAQEVHLFIRDWLGKKFTSTIAENVRILYGGSVKPANVAGLMEQPDIDGALVGGASLRAEDFEKIVRIQN